MDKLAIHNSISSDIIVDSDLPTITPQQMKQWKAEIAEQESILKRTRHNALDINNQMDVDSVVLHTENGENCGANQTHTQQNRVPGSEVCFGPKLPVQSREQLLQSIITKDTLNAKQVVAFQIIAGEFFKYVDDQEQKINKANEPNFKPYLHLLLSGPGGTGKTHVVNAVQQVMKIYCYHHNIRFLAPSGSAASLIDGMTIHKGLSIKVQKPGKGKGNRVAGDVAEDYSVLINIADRKSVREEFKDVILVMCDEVSLLSSQLMSNTDHALQYAKGNNEYFGGIIMIFAGDFYQYPPVFGSPLYAPIKDYAKATEQELLKRLG